jgi:hypothetical protein
MKLYKLCLLQDKPNLVLALHIKIVRFLEVFRFTNPKHEKLHREGGLRFIKVSCADKEEALRFPTLRLRTFHTRSQSKCTFSFNGITSGMAQTGKPMPPFDCTLVS